METIYNKWTYRCITESQQIEEILEESEPAPTSCRRGSAHTIDLNSVSVEMQISDKHIKVQEESVATGGNFRFAQMFIDGPTGTQPTESIYTWKKPISVLDIHIAPTNENLGDRVELSVLSPDVGLGYGGIGVLASQANPGDTAIYVSSTVMENTMVGYDLTLLGTTSCHLGEVIEKSGVTNQLIMEYPVGVTMDAMTTVVRQEIFISDNNSNYLGPPQRYPIGEGKIGASHVPAGSHVKAKYYNVDNQVNKKLFAQINYLY